MRQLTRDCFLSLQGGWDGNKMSKLLSQEFPPIKLKKLRQELLSGMALRSWAGTKSTCPHGLGETLTTPALGRVMSQMLPLGHRQLGQMQEKATRRRAWHPLQLPFLPPGRNEAENALFLFLREFTSK